MARRNDLAGLAALGALGLLLNKKQDGSSVPVEDRVGAPVAGDDQYNPDVTAVDRNEDYGNEGRRVGPVGIGKVRPAAPRPTAPARDSGYTGAGGSGGGRGPAFGEVEAYMQQEGRPLVDPERRKNYGMLESIKGYYSGNPFTAASAKREAANALNATAGLSIPQFIGDKTQKQYNAAAAARRSAEGFSPAEARAARDAAEAAAQKSRDDKVLNPMAWMAGPKRMETDFKKGGKVKKAAPQRSSASSRGDGIAKRGKTRGRMF